MRRNSCSGVINERRLQEQAAPARPSIWHRYCDYIADMLAAVESVSMHAPAAAVAVSHVSRQRSHLSPPRRLAKPMTDSL